MHKLSRRFLLMGGASALGVRPALANLFDCGGPCATMWEQLVQIADQVKSYATQVQQYFTEVQTYLNTVMMVATLPTQIWAQAQGDLSMVQGIANAASVLTGNAGSIISRLNTAGAYLNTLSMTPNQLANQFDVWKTTLGNAATKLGQLINQSSSDQASYAAKQDQIKGLSAAAIGETQAIQAGNQLTGLVSSQLQQVHMTLTAVAQEIATKDAIDVDKQSSADQATQQFLQQTDYTWSHPWQF
jgi:P-type conjugative transfer protein TrbJ